MTDLETTAASPPATDLSLARKSLGEKMRTAREARGISLDSLAISTRINRDYIVGLEQGDFSSLPSRVFARGFIRTLGRTVGLVEVDLVELLERCWEAEEPTDLLIKTTSHVRAKVAGSRSTNPLKMTQMAGLAAIISIGIVACVVGVLIFSNDRSTDQETVSQELLQPTASQGEDPPPSVVDAVSVETADVAPVEVPPVVVESAPAEVPLADVQPAPVQVPPAAVVESAPPIAAVPAPVVEAVAVEPVAVPAREPTAAELAPESLKPDELVETVAATATSDAAANVLKLVATNKVKVKITVDNQPARVRDLEPGEAAIEFKSSAQILVYDAGSVTIFFNGKELSPLGAKGRVRRLSFADSSQNTQTF